MKNFSAQYRVYYEDTDAGGVVYYANYLKFFERARTDFLRAKNILQNEMLQTQQTAFVVSRCEVDYIKAAKLDDLVEVSVIVEEVGVASIIMNQEMRCNEVVLAKLKAKIVCVDSKNLRPKRIGDFASKLI